MNHRERLRRVANEYWQPTDLQLAVEWGLNRLLSLEVEAVARDQQITRLDNLLLAASARIEAQSELLGRRAESTK